MALNKKHLTMLKKTKEGDKLIDELLNSMIYDIKVVNGKIVDIYFKEKPTLDLDDIERKVLKMRKEL